MATEKGIFKDDTDRFSESHQRICLWFVRNADVFVRRFFFDRPASRVKVTLEHLVVNRGYIIGFTDVLLEYETDCGAKECVLIEVKSRLHDFGACLRQLRCYHEFLPHVTKLCVVHADEQFGPSDESGADADLRSYFSSQGIYVADFQTGFWNTNYCSLPSGRRVVHIERAVPHGYDYHVFLRGRGFDDRGEDAETQSFIIRELDFIDPFCEFAGINPAPWYFDWNLRPFRELEGMKLLVDVEHFPGSIGHVEEELVALHLPDLSRTLCLRTHA